jgi:hypothetical protein
MNLVAEKKKGEVQKMKRTYRYSSNMPLTLFFKTSPLQFA